MHLEHFNISLICEFCYVMLCAAILVRFVNVPKNVQKIVLKEQTNPFRILKPSTLRLWEMLSHFEIWLVLWGPRTGEK